jgi:hypothetical protein
MRALLLGMELGRGLVGMAVVLLAVLLRLVAPLAIEAG